MDKLIGIKMCKKMQTFLPFPDFKQTAKVLDYRRLGKQRLEALMCLELILGIRDDNWKYHPVYHMWRAYPEALSLYISTICHEWINRGYKDTRLEKLKALNQKLNFKFIYFPSWLGDERFHASHRSILLGKNYDWYSQFDWSEKPAIMDKKGNWSYFWPVK